MNKKGVQCFSKAGDSWLSLIAHLAKRKMSHNKEHSQLLSALSKTLPSASCTSYACFQAN